MRDDEFLALQAAKKAAKQAKKKQKQSGGDATPVAVVAEQPAAEPPDTPVSAPEEPWGVEKKRKKMEAAWTDPDLPPLQDEQRWCCDCGTEFTYTVGEQQWFLDKGYAGGKTRCNDCTAAKKQRFGEKSGRGTTAAERASKTTCYTCGKTGHKTQQCPDAPCFNCECHSARIANEHLSSCMTDCRGRTAGGLTGHRSKDCAAPRLNQAGGGFCFKFQSGTCMRGASCRFAHVLEEVTVTS